MPVAAPLYMPIYIPTYGRPAKQITFAALPQSWQRQVVFVVRPEEAQSIKDRYGHLCKDVLTVASPGVAAARQAAVEHCPVDCLLFFDDDLRFSRRVPDWDYKTNNRALSCQPADMLAGLQWMTKHLYLAKYPMVALGGRGGNNGQPRRWVNEDYRIMRSFGVRKSVMNRVGVRFDDFYYWEDFHVCLTLLEQGHHNLVNVDIISDGITNAAGGVQRNVDKMWVDARRFAALHPHAVLKSKEFKWGPEKLTAPDFSVFWKKAYGSKVGMV